MDECKLTENNNFASGERSTTLLRVIPVWLKGPRAEVKVFALLDEGSTVTMMDSALVDTLGVKGTTEQLCVQWFDEQPKTEKGSIRTNLGIKGDFIGAQSFKLNNVRTVNDLRIPPYSVDVSELKQAHPYLKKIDMKSMKNVRPGLLIGIDNGKLTSHHRSFPHLRKDNAGR
jgi:hypothetical protein